MRQIEWNQFLTRVQLTAESWIESESYVFRLSHHELNRINFEKTLVMRWADSIVRKPALSHKSNQLKTFTRWVDPIQIKLSRIDVWKKQTFTSLERINSISFVDFNLRTIRNASPSVLKLIKASMGETPEVQGKVNICTKRLANSRTTKNMLNSKPSQAPL